MDYKYIEQLLERYWACETSVEEENILRAFFSQKELPAHLSRYKSLFEYERSQAKTELDESFDLRVLNKIGKEEPKKQVVIKANRLTLNYRLRPLYRAAAAIAIFAVFGTAIQHTFNREEAPTGWDYNAANYQDTYNAPQDAFEAGMGGIGEIQDMLRTLPNKEDSIVADFSTPNTK